MANDKILEVENLSVSFNTYAGEVKAVRGVSFNLAPGETLAFVGESGCGKSVTAKSLLRLLKPPFAVIKEGSKITCDGKDVLALNKRAVRIPRRRDQHDLPGSNDLAEPDHDRRQADHGKPAHPSPHE